MPFFVLFSKKMLTSSLEESRPKPSRKTAGRQQQQPLFTSNTEPSRVCVCVEPSRVCVCVCIFYSIFIIVLLLYCVVLMLWTFHEICPE